MGSKRGVEDFIYDAKNLKKYRLSRFLGKGGFARCYEFQDCESQESFACKVVQKSSITSDQDKGKMIQEISIHRSLSHNFIVGFHSNFEDEKCVYIMLELCRKRSLMEMMKRRKVLTEDESRFFLRQIVLACIYLHEMKVIHRDLKLGNLFLNDEMEIKVGDFGLATRLSLDGERRQTVCGTPNYIAPEILGKKGHSYEVDVWSLGCIMYTLLAGKPPFEAVTLKETYNKIRKTEYSFPKNISKPAKALISKMLQKEPSSRPSMKEIIADEFFVSGYMPERLPVSCLTMAPRFSLRPKDGNKSNARKPLVEIKDITENSKPSSNQIAENGGKDVEAEELHDLEQINGYEVPKDYYLSQLQNMVQKVIRGMPNTPEHMHEEALDPAAVPFVWISKWVDYSDKYGIGYALCDNSVGVLFNDTTRITLMPDGKTFYYIEQNGTESNYDVENYPSALNKKMTLLTYFCTYMTKNLSKAGAATKPREGDEFTQVPHLCSWFRTRRAMVFHLTNGTVQINYFEDHTKIVLCPLMGAISFIDDKQEFLSYRLSLIERYGASRCHRRHFPFVKVILDKLLAKYPVGKNEKHKK